MMDRLGVRPGIFSRLCDCIVNKWDCLGCFCFTVKTMRLVEGIMYVWAAE